MLLSAVSVLVVAQSISEIPEGLMNNPVFTDNSPQHSLQLCLIHALITSVITSIQSFHTNKEPACSPKILVTTQKMEWRCKNLNHPKQRGGIDLPLKNLIFSLSA